MVLLLIVIPETFILFKAQIIDGTTPPAPNIKIVDWGEIPEFDMIINATSVGLNKDDQIDLNLSKVGKNKFFYDVIYNPKETSFLKIGKKLGNETENGKLMFIYQAFTAFKVWHGVEPEINNEVIKLLD